MAGNLKVIGLTGGIASGKDRVADYLYSRGRHVIEVDKFYRRLRQHDEEVIESLKKMFGEELYLNDGTFNRVSFCNAVDSDVGKWQSYVALFNQRIKGILEEEIRKYQGDSFVNWAMLIESNFIERCTFLLIVKTTPELQIHRLIEREQEFTLDRQRASVIVGRQMSFDERLRCALRYLPKEKIGIIETNGRIVDLQRRVDEVLEILSL